MEKQKYCWWCKHIYVYPINLLWCSYQWVFIDLVYGARKTPHKDTQQYTFWSLKHTSIRNIKIELMRDAQKKIFNSRHTLHTFISFFGSQIIQRTCRPVFTVVKLAVELVCYFWEFTTVTSLVQLVCRQLSQYILLRSDYRRFIFNGVWYKRCGN